MPIKLNVNGRAAAVDAPGDMPLLWVIRDLLNLKGTKYGCGMSVVGMCTVHVDGEATRSCVTPVKSVEGKRITTIDGLSSDGSHPLQKAWIDLDELAQHRDGSPALGDQRLAVRQLLDPLLGGPALLVHRGLLVDAA